MTAPLAKPVQPLETNQEDNQQSQEQQFQEVFSSEVPEMSQLELATELFGAFLIGKAKKQDEILGVFSVFKRKNFYNDLLKLRNPQTFTQIENNFRLVKQEIDRQNNHPNNKGKQLDEYKVRLGIFSQKISHDEITRKSQAYTVASAVHRRINADDIRNKLGQTATVYGLTPQSTQELKRSMASWMKENPGRSYDDYMVIKGRQLYFQQQLKPGEKLDRNTQRRLEKEHGKILRGKTVTWRNQNDVFRVSTIKSQREMVMRAQEVIKGIAVQKGIFTDDQTKLQLDYVLHGKKELPAPSPTAVTTATPFPSVPVVETTQTPVLDSYASTATPITPASSLRPSLESPPPGITQIPAVSASTITVPTGRFARLQKIFSPVINSNFGKILGGAGKALGILGGGVGGLIKSGISNLAVKAGLNTVLPGYAAVSAVAKLLGVNLDEAVIQVTLKAALFAVAVPVGLIIILMLFLTGDISKMVPVGEENAIQVNSGKSTNSVSWAEFENKYLDSTINLSGNSWKIFEKENLLPQTPYLSLQNNSN